MPADEKKKTAGNHNVSDNRIVGHCQIYKRDDASDKNNDDNKCLHTIGNRGFAIFNHD